LEVSGLHPAVGLPGNLEIVKEPKEPLLLSDS